MGKAPIEGAGAQQLNKDLNIIETNIFVHTRLFGSVRTQFFSNIGESPTRI